MAKRRLSLRQLERIRARQVRQRQKARIPDASALHGLVVSRHGKQIVVEGDDGTLYRCTPRQNIGTPVVGDRVVFERSDERHGILLAIDERDTLLSRPTHHGASKPVAANIDRVFIVSALQPAPDLHLIDRYLVVIESLDLEGVVVVNKTDLAEQGLDDALQQALTVYRGLGYPVILSSTRKATGLDELREALRDHTSILVGQSGVGKSSLIKCLLPDIDIRIGKLSEIDQGRHTTTTSTLYHLPDGGMLIDSPGVRDFAVWHLTPSAIERGFREYERLRDQCRFRNCRHLDEPGCAVRQAVEQGDIDLRRYHSYRRMLDEIADSAR